MKLTRFAKFAWFVLGYNLLVIVWGAYVRASSSGAGCGNHWPLCNGEVVPPSPTLKTIVEFSHRLSSGLALLLVIAMAVWAFRAYARKDQVRLFAGLSLLFILLEALIGAGLVIFEKVADDKSIARAYWISGHLINTFLLIAAITYTAWAASAADRIRIRSHGSINWILLAATIGTLILGVSGAIAALGATLFPVASLAEGIRQDLSPTAHAFIRLRVFHPFIAIAVSALLILTAMLSRGWRPGDWTRKFSTWLTGLVIIQLAAGLANLLLHAPIWLQLVHLLLSDLIWIALALLAFHALSNADQEAALTAAEPLTAH